MPLRFGRQQQDATTTRAAAKQAARPAEAAGWVRRVYGERASALITELARMMRAAETEANVPRTEEPSEEPAGTDRQTLHDDLLELRNLMIAVDVSEDDHDRDLRLRAALSEAIGAASSLASASHNQPTAAYLRVAKPAIDRVLGAAGEPIA
ncbi:MAG: hypothetical protein JF886_03125 [Candidatus Dormibacteraeota bacterium]|uniref:Uncharacterized protein n=1 Tax=Candidatus Aeolococcus gillhamiae TaxID=3127015 RepID=A0A934JQP4_9BACT|nr:hypothetical protein [Candidatus Dormibacteraeota bacterium]